MKNQETQPTEKSPQQTKSNSKNRLSRVSLALGITATIIATVWMMAPTNAGTISSAAQIQAQIEFQKELIREQEAFQQKVDDARIEAEKKSAVVIKDLEQR